MNKEISAESLKVWEENAKFWDEQMGDESNRFHREVVKPKVTELLDIRDGDLILDIACGNGNYSAYIAEQGANVVAFDYSLKMINLAIKRQKKYTNKINFRIIDATSKEQLQTLGNAAPYNKAVSNMALMDITKIDILFEQVNNLLADGGIFVFATQHPCFVTLTEKYISSHKYKGEAIKGQPTLQYYYHRSLQDIFNLCFKTGFIIDGFYEECYIDKEKPDVIIVRVRKVNNF